MGLPPLAQPSPQELSKRRTHSPEFRARVAMEAIRGRKTVQGIAGDHARNRLKTAHLALRPYLGQPVEAAAAGWRERALHRRQDY